jgi:hypothetical protein
MTARKHLVAILGNTDTQNNVVMPSEASLNFSCEEIPYLDTLVAAADHDLV